jgi:hypothetical protein
MYRQREHASEESETKKTNVMKREKVMIMPRETEKIR